MRNLGFTLAEVLITLGVIGVVAAMTLPTLINEYQKHVWVNQLKKSVNIVENGFSQLLANEEVDNLRNTSVIREIYDDNDLTNITNSNKQKAYNMFQYFKISEIYTDNEGLIYDDNDDTEYTVVKLVDGTKLIFDDTVPASAGTLTRLYIDVNGNKKPNKYGRDVFNFELANNGKLYPLYGLNYAMLHSNEDISTNRYYWKNADNCNEQYHSGCAARIIENGWKMDY